MKKRADKRKDGDRLRERIGQDPSIFAGTFDKLNVAQDFELRKTVRQAGGSYQVVKNNVAAKASEGTPASGLLGDLKGTTSLASTTGDPVALAKALTAYAKANPAYTFKAGLVEGRVISIQDFQDLANMPPKEEIFAKLLYLINAPAQRLVTALNGTARNLAVVVNQGVEEKKFQE